MLMVRVTGGGGSGRPQPAGGDEDVDAAEAHERDMAHVGHDSGRGGVGAGQGLAQGVTGGAVDLPGRGEDVDVVGHGPCARWLDGGPGSPCRR